LQINMKILKTSFCVFLVLFTGILLSHAQEMPTLPQPILPLSATGRFELELRKARLALSENKQSEIYTCLSGIQDQINRRGDTWDPYWDGMPKEEFAAKEWAFYYLALAPLPSIKEIRDQERVSEIGLRSSVMQELSMDIDFVAKKYAVDRKKLAAIRSEYMAALLKKMREKEKELKEESALWFIRWVEDVMRSRVEMWDALVRGDPETVESRRYWQWERHKTLSGRKNIENAHSTCESFLERYENNFLRFLFRAFYTTPLLANEYIKKAGYSDERERATLLLRYQAKLSTNWRDADFDRYVEKVNLNFKSLKNFAEQDKVQKRLENERIEKKVEALKIQRESEEKKQVLALWAAIVEYRQKMKAEAEKRGEKWEPPPSEAVTN
jgi:hypothetical protein